MTIQQFLDPDLDTAFIVLIIGLIIRLETKLARLQQIIEDMKK